MKLAFFMFIYFSFSCCFAQINSMEYFYKGRCEESIPDFAALAVLEKQHCPRPINYEEQICTSRYRILRILDAASDTLRKEYLEAKEKPVSPYFRHRPMLIFGKHKNGSIQIEEYEETREYFSNLNSARLMVLEGIEQTTEFLSIASPSSEIYALHSIGTPYYNARNLDSIDMVFYNEYLIPHFKNRVEAAGKNFSELLLRLTYNRTPIKAAKIKNDFAALVLIEKMHPANSFKQANIYGLSAAIETIFKNDAKIDSNIAIFIDRERLPPTLGCLNSPDRYPFYLFGDLKNGSLIVESLVSTRDAFVFGDTIYDISMGFPFEELIAYFLPSNISLEEFKFGRCWEHLDFPEIRDGIISESLASLPDSLRKNIIEIATKLQDFLDKKRKLYTERKVKIEWPFLGMFPHIYYEFRCRKPEVQHPFIKKSCACYSPFASKGYGIWGKKCH
jgi:hypothetical protein